MSLHLLLIGGGVMQLPALKFAHQLGVKVLCFDGNPMAPARDQADWFEVCDIKDLERCLERARSHQKAQRLDGVLTVGTDFSTTVAWIAEHLGLPGTPYEAALLARDKGLMRHRFDEAGISSPRHQVFEGLSQTIPKLDFPFPVVVKPTDSMGARGVRLVHRSEDLPASLADAVGFSLTGRAIVEEYIDGPEFSVDAIVRDGQLIRCGLADRTIVFPPTFVEIGHTFPSTAPVVVQEAVWNEFERGVRALGLNWGAAKGDVKFSPSRGPVIGEIASRLSGGYMSGWTYPLTSGRSAVLWAVETALGLPLSKQPDEVSLPVAERAWIGLPGRIKAIHGVDQARDLPGVKDLFLLVAPGTKTVFPRNNVEKLGNVIVAGTQAKEVEETARLVRNLVVFEYEYPNPATELFLQGTGADPWWFPEARGLSETSAGLLERARAGAWKDLYGNTLEDLLVVLRKEGMEPSEFTERVWRSLLVGGLCGARYASPVLAENLQDLVLQTGAKVFWEPYRDIVLLSDTRHRLSIDLVTGLALGDGKDEFSLQKLDPITGQLDSTDFQTLLSWWNNQPVPTKIPAVPVTVERTGQGPRIQVLVLDAGHGGTDPGSIGRHTIDGKEVVLREKDLTLTVALELQKLLTEAYPDRTIVLTRKNDTYPTLERRVQIAHAQKLGDQESIFFLSLHFNASLNRKARGLELWYVPQNFEREVIPGIDIPESVFPVLNTLVDSEYKKESRELAEHLARGLAKELGDSSVQRGLKENPWFVVRMARMPAVLAELGFITNPEEAESLHDPNYLKKLAQGLYNGLESFIHNYEDLP